MKYLLAALFMAGALVASCNAQCFVARPRQLKADETLEGCNYKGELHQLDSKWTEDCVSCSCSADGHMRCCGAGKGPAMQGCEFKLNKVTCEHEPVPSVSCPLTAKMA
ncbi:beta-microseminoprotein E1-like [Hyperolius riggenbachi]|uniref:beta-microseminoprotein E1-like n=1 Tax=Hyperolius riggenbachi TaxID=752182 RepID=UPI0035A3A052